MTKQSKKTILEVKNLEVEFHTEIGTVSAVNGVNMQINSGQAIGVVGESGCGKSVTASSALQILPNSAEIVSGEINFMKEDKNVVNLLELDSESKEMRNIRGNEIAMIFQEPMRAFSPVHTVGNQISEAVLLHQDMAKYAAKDKAIELLDLVGISNPTQRVNEYPFQLSGGMTQRAMIAMALACNPRLLIADEPTTALDVTIQAQVLQLIKEMQGNLNLSLMLITHDLGVIAHMVDHVYVMYLGRIVENAPVIEIFDNPEHPYTRDLLRSIPKVSGNQGKLASIEGSVPDTYNIPTGCAFHPRCRETIDDICQKTIPKVININENHQISCCGYQREGGSKNANTAG